MVLDSTVGVSHEFNDKEHEASGLCNECWSDLSKTAKQASDSDVKDLTKNLQNNWTDISAITKLACLDAQALSPSALSQETKGPVQIETALKLAFVVSDLTLGPAVATIGKAGMELASWLFGGGQQKKDSEGLKYKEEAKPASSEKPKAAKPETAGEEEAEPESLVTSILKDITPESLQRMWNSMFSSEGSISALSFFPNALVKPDSILFSMIEDFCLTDETRETKKESGETTIEKNARGTAVNTTAQTHSTEITRTASASSKPLEASANKQKGETSKLTVEEGKVYYTDGKKVEISGCGDGNFVADLRCETSNGRLILDKSGKRTYQKDGHDIYTFFDPTHFQAGEFQFDGDVITQVIDGKPVLVATRAQIEEQWNGSQLVFDETANNLQEALANFHKKNPQPSDKTLYFVFKGGVALVHPSIGKGLELLKSADGTEFRYDLGNGQTLLRSPQGKMFIVAEDKSVKELSDEQKQALIASLGVQAKLIQNLLRAMDSGETVEIAPGMQATIDNSGTTFTETQPADDKKKGGRLVVRRTDHGYSVEDQESDRSSCFDEKTGEYKTRSKGKETTINLHSPLLDMMTADFVRKDGAVTFTDTNTRIEADGTAILPDGTRVSPRNDIHFANGAVLYADGTFVASNKEGMTAGLPNKPGLDAFVSQALGMANAISARVAAGNASFADVSLIEANMAIVQNFINLFSLMGNLPMANGLHRSWSMLKDSHGRAQHDLHTNENDSQKQVSEKDVQALFKSLESATWDQSSPASNAIE